MLDIGAQSVETDDVNTLVKLTYGSGLYGTRIPTSDTDYRGVYLPSREDCFLNRVKDTITDASEEDTQYYSLSYFLNLACQGQSIAIECLAAPESAWEYINPMWRVLHDNRRRFYTKSMHSFLGFAKSMAGKYSSRADRLAETEAAIDVLWAVGDGFLHGRGNERLSTIWDELPESPNAIKTINERNGHADKRAYVVCGRELQATVTIGHALRVIQSISDSYGDRVRNAKDGKIEWKALSHAFRVALQAREIVETGDLVYPLKDADYLRNMRLGKIDFMANSLDKRLDDLIAEVQVKMDASDLPDKADAAWCDRLILNAYSQ